MYLIQEMYTVPGIQTVIGILALLIIVLNIQKASRLYKWAGLSFFLLGIIFYWVYVPTDVRFFDLFGSMVSLLALLFILPFMSTIISVGKYDRALSQMISMPPKPDTVRLYRRTSLMSYLLTLFLNVATVPVVVATVKSKLEQLSNVVVERFFAHSILRAYAMLLLWSPTEILVASTVDMTGQSYLTLLPTLFTISLIFVAIDWWIHNRKLRGVELQTTIESPEDIHSLYKKLLHLGVAITFFIITLLTLNSLIPQTFLFTVTILIIPFTFIWSAFIKKPKRFRVMSWRYLRGNTTQLHGLFFLFLSAGFFVEVFPYTVLFDYMNVGFDYVYSQGSLLFFYLLTALCIFGLALVGFHPLISIAIISPFLTEAIAAHPYGVSVLLIGVGLSTVMIGPFNVTPTVLAMQLQANPYNIIRKNLAFAFGYLLFIVLIAFVFSLIL
ncbi:hypothetical protein [Geomicrobium sp. JCM 19039]|uniref:hypothetical protein n=1 Tax=Geomicrobium sp. JCM 19039 TaxID=1460636 RepID=UPI00045F4BCA|nr:hypothetical protein [Geomicrobium sp. JCM 19039]GAK12075.1 hypothetical protein JCM19039_1804 [Geomicrobium sp. JCM 19039]